MRETQCSLEKKTYCLLLLYSLCSEWQSNKHYALYCICISQLQGQGDNIYHLPLAQQKVSLSLSIYESVIIMRICAQNYTYNTHQPTGCGCLFVIFYSMRICAQPTIYLDSGLIIYMRGQLLCAYADRIILISYTPTNWPVFVFHILFHAHMRTAYTPRQWSHYLYERVVVMRICGQNYTYIQYTPTNWLSQCSMFYSMRICAQPGQQMATFRLSEKKRASDLVKKKRATRMNE